jgi:hypothetical protein
VLLCVIKNEELTQLVPLRRESFTENTQSFTEKTTEDLLFKKSLVL